MEEAAAAGKTLQKTYIELLGICCSSEVPVVESILNSLQGIKEYKVIVPTKTVIVVHDPLLVSQLQIVKALNQARLEATVKVNGSTSFQKKWPSPYAVISGVLLALSFLKYVYSPFRWVALGAVAVGIFPLLLKGIASARKLRLDTNILMLIAAVGTVCLGDYTEAGTIVFLFCIAEWLETRAGYKAQAVMSSLMSIAPQRAVIAETGEDVDVNDVKLDTVLAIKAGEVIPIDGVVVDGMCEVDEKTLTGESFPVAKEKDSTVWAGTINLNGYVTVKTTALAEDCVVAKMTKLVEEAQNSKSATQRYIDRIAQYYTPAVVILSAGLVVVPLALRVHNRSHWFHLAVVVLVSACPCALILSTPVATFCALTKAATAGLLIKGGDYLETLAKIKVIAFDKTGTLTRGEFVVNDFESLCHDISSDTLLYWASSIESKSSHPMAAAVVDYARSRSVEAKPENVEEFQNYPGEGIHGRTDGHSVYIGNKRIAVRAGSGTVPIVDDQKAQGKTIGFIYFQGRAVGVFSLSDVCRTGVKEALDNLKLLNIKSAMLTGDSQSAAMQTQEQLGNALNEVYSELLPEDKATIIQSLKKEGATAMVGDGINDAPALATADIGISMGISGSALATETGQVILMSNDLRKVPKAIQLARKAHRKVIENVFVSITAKAAILALAFAGHPLVWAAVLADVGTCLLVIMNSMLLLHGTTQNHGGKCCKMSDALPGHKDCNNRSTGIRKNCCSEKKDGKMCNTEDATASDSCCTSKSCGKEEFSSLRKRRQDQNEVCGSGEANQCHNGSFHMVNLLANNPKCHEDITVGTSCCKTKSCRKNESSDSAMRIQDQNDLEANIPKSHEDVPVSCCKTKCCKKNESSNSAKRLQDQTDVEANNPKRHEDVPASCCKTKSCRKNESSNLAKRLHQGQNDPEANDPKCHKDVPGSCCKTKCCNKNESLNSAKRLQDQNDPEATDPKRHEHVPAATSCCKSESCRKNDRSDSAKRHEVCKSDKEKHCHYGDWLRHLDDEAGPDQITVDILTHGESSNTTAKQCCSSSEERETAACCRSYLEECCRQHVQMPNCGFGGGLLEIVTQ